MSGDSKSPDGEKPPGLGSLITGDWWKLGAVAAVAVVLALIGSAIAGRFEPTGVAPPVAVEDTTTSSPATDVTESAPTPSFDLGGVTTTLPRQSTTLSLSTELIDFAESAESVDVEIANAGTTSASWTIMSADPAVTVEPSSGDLGGGQTVIVTATLDRSIAAEGVFETTVTLNWEAGEVAARAIAVQIGNPIIHNPQASPSTVQVDGGGSCSPTRTTISARVRDSSPLENVIARWSPDGSATVETPLSPIGEDIYEGQIGPFTAAQSAAVRIIAFDDQGNAGGAPLTVTVVACP